MSRRARRGAYAFREAPRDVIRGRPAGVPTPGRRSSVPPNPFLESLPAPPTPPSGTRHHSEVRLRPRPRRTPPLSVEAIRSTIDAVGTGRPSRPADPVEALLREILASSPETTVSWEHRVERHAEAILPRLTQLFPGPLWFDRRRPHRSLPGGEHVSALARALVHAGAAARPWVAQLLVAPSEHVRFHACLVAGSLAHPELLDPLGHVLLEGERDVRRAAQEGLRAHARFREYAGLLEALRGLAENGAQREVWRLRAIEALGALGDPAAPDVLVELLADEDRAIARAAHEALREITAHDLGTLRRPWQRWLRNQRWRPRSSWLVAALADRRADLRLHALRELERIVPLGIDLPETAPPEDWADAQMRYADWLRRDR